MYGLGENPRKLSILSQCWENLCPHPRLLSNYFPPVENVTSITDDLSLFAMDTMRLKNEICGRNMWGFLEGPHDQNI